MGPGPCRAGPNQPWTVEDSAASLGSPADCPCPHGTPALQGHRLRSGTALPAPNRLAGHGAQHWPMVTWGLAGSTTRPVGGWAGPGLKPGVDGPGLQARGPLRRPDTLQGCAAQRQRGRWSGLIVEGQRELGHLSGEGRGRAQGPRDSEGSWWVREQEFWGPSRVSAGETPPCREGLPAAGSGVLAASPACAPGCSPGPQGEVQQEQVRSPHLGSSTHLTCRGSRPDFT